MLFASCLGIIAQANFAKDARSTVGATLSFVWVDAVELVIY